MSILGVSIIYLANYYSCSYMIQRKLFHVLVLFIFIPGLQEKVLLSAAFLSALNILLILEAYRHFSPSLNHFFCKFIDSRDNEKVIVTHIYLLVGVGFPVLVSNFIQNDAVALSGIVSLGIGDTFASLIGFYFGKMKIPYRHKTIEGTLAC